MLESVDGVAKCDVDFSKSTATCTLDGAVDAQSLIAALKEPYKGALVQ
ncbi:MAG: heavy-metal-associated domain-containing protein [Planctomycetes bacterium]|nr:heavy-metal-associated domain-containing protein [Planctomycetota bacterium]